MIFSSLAVICVSKLLTTGGYKGILKAANKLVIVKKSSNATLKCLGMSGRHCFFVPVLTWRHRNKTIVSNDKYIVRERKGSECPNTEQKELEFFLEIRNVTEADSGVYQCQMHCQFAGTLRDSIQVVNYFELGKIFSKLFQ